MSRARDRLQDLWLPSLVGLTGVVVSVAVWGVLVAERREQILAVAADTGSESREAVRRGLEHQFQTLRGLRDLWIAFGLREAAEWRENVAQHMDGVAGLVSIAWVDLEDARNRIVSGDDASVEATWLDLAEMRSHLDAPHVEGPERDPSGAVQYRVFLPLQTREGHAGILVARLLAAPFLEDLLSARARGYAITVSWRGEEIFSRGTLSTDPWQEWWRSEGAVELPFGGGEWRLVLRPTPGFAAMRLTPIPHYLLGAGLLLSLVLALSAYQLRLILRQSGSLVASNRTLEQRGTELELRVAERTEALQDAVNELEAFNYSVSHDLRSPLGAILNFAAILEDDHALDPDGAALLARIRRSALRATNLLEGLLRFSRAGRAGLTFERVDMTELVRQTFAQVRASEDDAEVELVVEPLPEALGDRALLGDLLANVLGNALKYSRGCEKRRITVTGRIERQECIYEIADNGRGFDMRYADKLFQLFERLESDDDVEGTGVGLAMVARIVKRHGGRVWAEGRLGEGARFSFALPAPEAS